MDRPRACPVCGNPETRRRPILWAALIDAWQLSPAEVEYVNRQQGEDCTGCGANLRSMALADALRAVFGTSMLLADFVGTQAAAGFQVLEINEAGTLGPALRRMPGHVLASYPAVDMHALPYPDGRFDVIVHSDTLEHVHDPLHALGECRRVLKPGGALCFTVPVIVGRLSRSRAGLAKSHHGNPAESGDDFVVHTEFGSDAWTYPMQAGFREVRLFSVAYPAALAMAAFA